MYARRVLEHEGERRTRWSISVTFNRVVTARGSPAKASHSPPRRSAPIIRSTNRVSLIACARAQDSPREKDDGNCSDLRGSEPPTLARVLALSRSLARRRCSSSLALVVPSEPASTAASSCDFCVAPRAEDKHRLHAPRRPHRQHQEALYGGARLPLALESFNSFRGRSTSARFLISSLSSYLSYVQMKKIQFFSDC